MSTQTLQFMDSSGSPITLKEAISELCNSNIEISDKPFSFNSSQIALDDWYSPSYPLEYYARTDTTNYFDSTSWKISAKLGTSHISLIPWVEVRPYVKFNKVQGGPEYPTKHEVSITCAETNPRSVLMSIKHKMSNEESIDISGPFSIENLGDSVVKDVRMTFDVTDNAEQRGKDWLEGLEHDGSARVRWGLKVV